MTIRDLKEQDLIIYECISGSKAYGLDLPTSDTDIKGVFVLPQDTLYGLRYTPQVSDENNDMVYYELGRFIELLMKNNPNLLELLATPEDKILIRHPIMDRVQPSLFLSKKCKDTFGGFAFTQIRKAMGLNKKIVNPVDKEKKTILEFCHVMHRQGSLPLQKWLEKNYYKQEQCGLVNIPHAKDVYGIYYDPDEKLGYKGVIRKPNATSVLLSSIPKEAEIVGYLYFNSDGYISYCKDYREYWDWVDKRNDARYQNNVAHGKNYDSKNMMHTFRLLDMAVEILSDHKILVKRPNREELLAIRRGEWEYDQLIEMAESKMEAVDYAYRQSTLPEAPDEDQINALLIEMRHQLYHS
jgi:hypothetical protein